MDKFIQLLIWLGVFYVFIMTSTYLYRSNTQLAIVSALCAVIVFMRVVQLAQPDRFEKPQRTNTFAYAKPSDIVYNLRDNDKNYLMFGRSRDPTDAKTKNSDGNEILRGYIPSDGMGEQYGEFTGMSLYGGPEMYEQRELNRVFGYTSTLGTTDKREMSPELTQAITQHRDNENDVNKKDLFKALLNEKNKEISDLEGIYEYEKLNVSDFTV